MPKLFDDDEYESDVEFKTNTDYATHYNTWRQKEELNRLKTKYGDVALDEPDSDESSSSDEDEIGIQLTEEFEKDFFKTLACLKTKDPKIYDQNIKFFNDDLVKKEKDVSKKSENFKSEKKKDPLLLSNYEKKMISRTGGKFDEDNEESEDDQAKEDPRSNSPTYVEEQKKLKESLKKAIEDEEDNEENWGGMFKKRLKSEEQAQKEEDEYSQWLKGQKNELTDKNVENELEPLKDYWNNPKLDKEEAFLRDYLLNKRYLEKANENYIPTYDEIIHDSDEGLSEDEKNIDKQEEFETKYNFRFEEPDEEYIKRYPRTMANSVRKVDDRRKLKRAEIKERKEEEKKRKQEELKQLKTLKKKEIEEKINKLREITGNNDLNFEDNDFDGDFDPEDHDRKMQQLFNDDYYAGEEGDQKPEFGDLEEELGPWAHENEPHCEDDDFIMDCDYDPTAASTSKELKKRKRNRFDKKGNKIEKIEFDENDKRFEKYTDELYKLDYEDMIGDIPCRFKYREVVPNSFGLSIEEILIAKDRELNRWCSLKKAVQHRPENVEKYEQIAYNKKAQNEALKKKILTSLFEELEEPTEDEIIKLNKEKLINETKSTADNDQNSKKSNKKEHIKNESTINISQNIIQDNDGQNIEEENQVVNPEENNPNPKKSKKKNKNSKTGATTNNTEINTPEDCNDGLKEHPKKNKTVTVLPKNNSDDKTETNEKSETINDEISKSSLNDSKIKPNGKLSRRQKKNLKKLSLKSAVEKSDTVQFEDNNLIPKNKKRKRKITEVAIEVSDKTDMSSPKKKFKKSTNGSKNKNIVNKNKKKEEMDLSNSRLKAYGFNPKKFKNKLKYKKPVPNKD